MDDGEIMSGLHCAPGRSNDCASTASLEIRSSARSFCCAGTGTPDSRHKYKLKLHRSQDSDRQANGMKK